MRVGSLLVVSLLLSASSLLVPKEIPAQTTPSADASASQAAPSANGPLRKIGGGVSSPIVIFQANPEFSDEARKQLTGGMVLLSLIVDPHGQPQNVHVLRGVGLGLDEKAVEAVRQYRFKPAMEGGQPVAVELHVEVNFQFKTKDEAQADAALNNSTEIAQQQPNSPLPVHVSGCAVDSSVPTEGDIALRSRRYIAAEKSYAEDLVANPASTAAMAGLVRTALAEGKPTDALAMVLKDASTHPTDPILLDALGEVRFRRGETDEAAKAFNQSMTLDRCNGVTHYDMYRFLNLSGMYASAQHQLDFAHSLSPQNADIAARWRATHAVPLTTDQRLARLQQQLANATLTDVQKDAIEAAIKGIQASEKGSCEQVVPVTEARFPLIPISTVAQPDVMYEAGLEVQLNGKKRRLEVDTGASGLILTSAVAKAAGLTSELEIKTSGLGDEGAANSFVSHVDDIRIGSMEFKNCEVRVLEPGNMLEKTPDVDGLIGPDVFRDYVVTLDFPQRQMLLGPLPKRSDEQIAKSVSLATSGSEPNQLSIADRARDRYVAPEMKDWTPIFRSGHYLIFGTYIGKAPVKLFLMDSGSSHSMISIDAANEVASVSGFTAPTMKGINGEVQKVLVADKINLWFAGVGQVVSDMTSIDTSSLGRSVGADVSGIIGFPTLRELVISIDYRDSLVHVVYDPKKGYHGGK